MNVSAAGRNRLALDPSGEAARIEQAIREQLQRLKRRGAVVGVSGGVDSAVVAGLCARALGPGRVLALSMPERGASGDSTRLGRLVAERFGLKLEVVDVTGALEALGCYQNQVEAIRSAFPEYAPHWRFKLTLPPIDESNRLSVFRLVVDDGSGRQKVRHLSSEAYRRLVAATNFKQRARKMVEYFHADRLGYAVAGTPNRLEYDQGFFVKQGDGAADFKPIAHLYKTQVYRLAEYLGVPEEIRSRPPSTDTFSLEQTQEEFYFALPYAQLDLCLYGLNNGLTAEALAPELGLSPFQVQRAYDDIQAKRRATRYLHERPLLVAPVPEV